ncbi:MAG: zinc ribbon domain-containing protein [Thermomicrobiales bacterium]
MLADDLYASWVYVGWRTVVERDAADIPFNAARPAEDRYALDGVYPALIDPATARAARAAIARHRRGSRRDDRPAEVGLLRFGFARCAGCGRAMAAVTSAGGRMLEYKCEAGRATGASCPAPATIVTHKIDGAVWAWVTAVMQDAAAAARWRIVPVEADPAAVAALATAEAALADVQGRASALLDNLGLLTGAAARIAAEKVNGPNDALAAKTAERDRLGAAVRAAGGQGTWIDPVPETAITDAAFKAIRAMQAADPDAVERELIVLPVPAGYAVEGLSDPAFAAQAARWRECAVEVPATWTAQRAALSVLDVTATVARLHRADGPCWTAEMKIGGAVGLVDGYYPAPNRASSRRRSSSPRRWG